MLKDRENDLLHLLSMLESLEKIIQYSENVETAEGFFEIDDQKNYNAVLTLLMFTGETVAKMSSDIIANEKIPWDEVRGLRNRIAHDYSGLDYAIIFDTVKNHVPGLLARIYLLTKSRLSDGILSMEELDVATGNRYYGHIDFHKLKNQ